jgi:hypothetical protein
MGGPHIISQQAHFFVKYSNGVDGLIYGAF